MDQKPWYRRRALRVFRDDTGLAVTPHLWGTIEQALGQSRFLIVLTSPEAARRSRNLSEPVHLARFPNCEFVALAKARLEAMKK
jgi:hypothetical protein